jgi:hypothetical protein
VSSPRHDPIGTEPISCAVVPPRRVSGSLRHTSFHLARPGRAQCRVKSQDPRRPRIRPYANWRLSSGSVMRQFGLWCRDLRVLPPLMWRRPTRLGRASTMGSVRHGTLLLSRRKSRGVVAPPVPGVALPALLLREPGCKPRNARHREMPVPAGALRASQGCSES